MNFQVAIPSYQRPFVLVEKTLLMLLAGGVSPEQITVFCHDNDTHLANYRCTLRQVNVRCVATGARGIRAQRAEILRHYPAKTRIVFADDDVSALLQLQPDGKKLIPVVGVAARMAELFRDTHSRGLSMWGCAPVANAFYMDGKRVEGLRFIKFTLAGIINQPGHPAQEMTVETKEDYELSLRQWWYHGGVLRDNGLSPKADHYTKGGCAQLRTAAVEEASVQTLMHDWPGLVRRNTRRKNAYAEILLASRARGVARPSSAGIPVAHG